jgi:hypothetical protein
MYAKKYLFKERGGGAPQRGVSGSLRPAFWQESARLPLHRAWPKEGSRSSHRWSRQPGIDRRFPVCSSGDNLNRRSSSWPWVGICAFHFRTATWRNCWPSGACTPITSRYGDWVQRYAPEMKRRLRPRLKPTNDSWRVDETYIRVKGKWVYLYRGVDSSGATIDFLLSAKRNAAAAERRRP